VGKTYGWNRYLTEAAAAKSIELKRYAYVSLFGLNSLDNLKYALFENTVPVESIESGPTFDSLRDVKDQAEKFLRRTLQLANVWSTTRTVLQGLERAVFFAVRNQIVCIDDLERAGRGLAVKDVLGMATFQKERRRCKVVLLLNEEELSEEDRGRLQDPAREGR
jgi:hypothetical protein